MSFDREPARFENRYDAGRQLAASLEEYKGKPSVIVLAIPNGGLPVALEVALALEADLDVIISRKIPLPLNPEAGFGAVADDGTVIFNDELVAQAGLNTQQINYQVNRVRADIRQRTLLYGKHQALRVVKGKTIIIIDDGLASGYTMMAAVASVRRHQPREIIVAVPAASATAREKLAGVADKVVAVAVGTSAKFYVADFYRHWHDLTDDEAVECLTKWRRRRFETNVKPRPGKA